MTSKAPVTETLAAALILLTPWKKDRILVDPFCGSGTFPIEAAMMAADIAPGMKREFTAEKWGNLIERKLWYEGVEEAEDLIQRDITVDIQGYDIDKEVVKATGALLVISRYPLLCRESPEVSIPTVTSSFIKNRRSGYSGPDSGNHSIWYFPFIRSTIAFFTIDCISEGLNIFTEGIGDRNENI